MTGKMVPSLVNLIFPLGNAGADSGGGGRTRRVPPLKLVKIWFFFGVNSWFFTRNTPKIFAPPSARRNFFKCAPPNLKAWIRPWNESRFGSIKSLFFLIYYFSCRAQCQTWWPSFISDQHKNHSFCWGLSQVLFGIILFFYASYQFLQEGIFDFHYYKFTIRYTL